MKYKKYIFLLFLFPLSGISSENSKEFAQFNTENRILTLKSVSINDGSTYYGRKENDYLEPWLIDKETGFEFVKGRTTYLYLGEDGSMRPISIASQLVNNSRNNFNKAESFIINHFDSNSGILTIPLLEVDEETTYKNIKIQLHSNNWNLLQTEENNCKITIQTVSQIKLCMTIAEIENIVGCPGIIKTQGNHAFLGNGSHRIWKDLSVSFRYFGTDTEKAIFYKSEKYGLKSPQNGKSCF